MAFSNVVIQEARYNAINSPYAQNSLRRGDFTAIRLLLEGAQSLLPEFASIRQSSAQATKALVMARVAAGVKTARQCVAAGTGTPSLQTLTWATILEEFRLNDVEFQNNQVAYRSAFDFMYAQKAANMYERHLEEIADYLEASKSTVNTGSYFPAIAAGVKTIPLEQEDNIFAGLMAEMKDNKYFGPFWVFGNYNFWADYSFTAAQGSSNAINKATFANNFQFAHIPVENDTNMKSTFYVVPAGSVGMMLWLRPDFRTGVSRPNSGIKSTTRLPGVMGMPNGMLVELKYDEACTGEAEFEEGWSFSIDNSLFKAYDETAGAAPIFKYQVTSVAAV